MKKATIKTIHWTMGIKGYNNLLNSKIVVDSKVDEKQVEIIAESVKKQLIDAYKHYLKEKVV